MITIAISIIITLVLIFFHSKWTIRQTFTPSPKRKRTIIALAISNFLPMLLIIIGLLGMKIMGKGIGFVEIAIILIIITIIPQLLLLVISIPLNTARLFTKNRFIPCRKILVYISIVIFVILTINQLIPTTNIQTIEKELKITNLPKEFDGLTIVQLSDIHISSLSKAEYNSLKAELIKINDNIQPDIYAITGDLVHSRPNELKNKEDFLSILDAKIGKYFVYGNHDIGLYNHHLSRKEKDNDIDTLDAILHRNNFEVLRDTLIPITRGDETIYIMNIHEDYVTDYVIRHNKITNKLSSKDVILSLSHNPTFFDMARRYKARLTPQLTLAGHTHAMQTELFGFSPSDIIHKYSRGLYTIESPNGNSYLYINRGIGYHVFRRIGSQPEITVIRLRTA